MLKNHLFPFIVHACSMWISCMIHVHGHAILFAWNSMVHACSMHGIQNLKKTELLRSSFTRYQWKKKGSPVNSCDSMQFNRRDIGAVSYSKFLACYRSKLIRFQLIMTFFTRFLLIEKIENQSLVITSETIGIKHSEVHISFNVWELEFRM